MTTQKDSPDRDSRVGDDATGVPDREALQAALSVWEYLQSRLHCVATMKLSDDWITETQRVMGLLITTAMRRRAADASATMHAKAVVLDALVDALRRADMAREMGR